MPGHTTGIHRHRFIELIESVLHLPGFIEFIGLGDPLFGLFPAIQAAVVFVIR
jgi:hypothetical protein